MLGLFIIYSLYRKNIMKGGEISKPGSFEGKYEKENPTPGNSYHYITVTIRNNPQLEWGYMWRIKSGFEWFINKGLFPTGRNYPYKNMEGFGNQIKILKDKNNEFVIGLISSEGDKFIRVGDIENQSKDNVSLKDMDNYSVKDLENIIEEKNLKKKMNTSVRVHSEFTNYELFIK